MGMFIREKKIYCGKDFMEVDIYPISSEQLKKTRTRKKKAVSAPAQRNLNEKNAKRYFRQLIKTNFTDNDLHVTCTYNKEHLPASHEEADKEVTRYIRRLQYWAKKHGRVFKYVLVTEGKGKKSKKRVHHHIIVSGIDRSVAEDLWSKKGVRIGYVNTDRLQVGDDGLGDLAGYLSKDPEGKKRWRGSKNLQAPLFTTADKKWSKRKLMETAQVEDDNYRFWAKMYPGWRMTRCESVWNDITGWSIYIEMRRLN